MYVDPFAAHAGAEPKGRCDDRGDRHRPRHRDPCEHERAERLGEEQPDRDGRVAEVRERPQQRDAAEEAADMLVGGHVVRQRAEVGGEPARERLAERH